MTDCYDCAQLNVHVPGERIVGKTAVCDFHYRGRMGLPMLANQKYPPAPPPDEPKQAAKPVQSEGIRMNDGKCWCGNDAGHRGRHRGGLEAVAVRDEAADGLGAFCRCNCGKRVRKDSTKEYIKGHQPAGEANVQKAIVPRGLDRTAQVLDAADELNGKWRSASDSERYVVKLSAAQLDALLLSLPPK